MDEGMRDRDYKDIDNGSFRKDQTERIELLDKIGVALHKYGGYPEPRPGPWFTDCITRYFVIAIPPAEKRATSIISYYT